jgi:hypothetical protein
VLDAAFERLPFNNLDMRETGTGGRGGQMQDRCSGVVVLSSTLSSTIEAGLHGTRKLGTETPFVVIAQNSATLNLYITRPYPCRGCPVSSADSEVAMKTTSSKSFSIEELLK